MSHDLQVHLPAGLREAPLLKSKNAAVIQDMIETQEERVSGIKSVLQPGIERKFNTPRTGVPTLDKDTLVPRIRHRIEMCKTLSLPIINFEMVIS
jgi:hypothetical protein